MRVLSFIFGCCITFFQVTAQQYTSLPIGDFATNGPFSTTPAIRKAQMIYTPQELSALGQSGVISKLYFRIGSANPGNLRVLQMQISLGATNDTSFTSSQFYTSLKRVNTPLSEYNFTQPTPIGGYLVVELDTPFVYDASKSLIVEVSANIIINGVTSAVFKKNARRLAANNRTATTGAIDSMQWAIGFDYGNFFNIDAGISGFTPASSPLNPGTTFTPIVQVSNQGIDSLHNVVVALQVDTQAIIRNSWQGGLALRQASSLVMNQNFTTPTHSRMVIKAWTENPNGSTDGNTQNDTLRKEYCIRYPGGTLYVGGPSANYPSLDSCFNDLACRNITGPTTIILAPGIYDPISHIPDIPGHTSSNPITIRSAFGNPNSVRFRSDSLALLTLNSKSLFRFIGLSFERLGLQQSDSGVVRLINCTNIIFDSCVFIADTAYFPTATHRQLNFSILRSIQIQLLNSSFSGGDVAISAIGLSTVKVADLRVENNQFGFSRYAHLNVIHADVVRFNGNKSQRLSNFHSNQSTLYFEYCNRINILRNRFEGLFNGPVITLNGAYNSTTLNFSNLIANNLFSGELNTNGPFIQTANLPGVLGYTQVDIQYNNFDLLSNQTNNMGSFILLGVAFPSSITNNLIRIKGNHQQGQLLSFRDAASFPFVTIANNVYDYSFASHAGYVTSGPNYAFTDFQVLGKDSNSFVHPFDYLPGNQLKPAINFFNRRARISQWVVVDHLNNVRSATPDIGAYEFPSDWSIRILGNYFSHTDTPNSRTLYAEIEATDSITHSRLIYRKNGGNWQQQSGIYTGTGGRFAFNLHPRSIQPRLLPGDTIFYYITVHTATDSSCWPLSDSNAFVPASIPYFVYGSFLSGNYSIGTQNRDFATIPLAMQALQQKPVWDTVNFILYDTLYTLNTYTMAVPRIQIVDSLSHLVIRPADSVNVSLELPLGANRPIVELINPRNTTFTGQSINQTGTLSLFSSDTTNRGLISILNIHNQPITNNRIQYLRLFANNINNKHTAVQAVMIQPSVIKGLTVSHNQIRGAKCGIYIHGYQGITTVNAQSVFITDNEIGHADSSYSASSNGITVGNLDSAIISGNRIQNLLSNNHLEDVIGILTNGPMSNTLISRNKIYRLQLDHPSVNVLRKVVGIQLGSGSISCIGNEISSLSSNSTSGLNAAANVYGIYINSLRSGFVAHNSIYLYGHFNFGSNNDSRLINIHLQPQARNVVFSSNFLVNLAKTSHPNRFFRILQLGNDPNIDGHLFVNNVYSIDTTYSKLFYSLNNAATNLDFRSWLNFVTTVTDPKKEKEGLLLPLTQSPFLQTDKLEPISAVRPYLNQRAERLNWLLPADLNGFSRPAFGDSIADIGAYELQASFRADAEAPVVDSFWSDLPAKNCSFGVRSFFADLRDQTAVKSVQLLLNINDIDSQMTMQRISGNNQLGRWGFQLGASSVDRWATARLIIEDSLGNLDVTNQLYSFQDAGLKLKVSRDTLLALGDTLQLMASSTSLYTIAISELSYNAEYLTGNWPIPSYFDNPGGDYLEIANWGTDTVDLSGLRVGIGPNFFFPQGTKLPPQKVTVLCPAPAGTQRTGNPDSLYFIMPGFSPIATNDFFALGSTQGIFLASPLGDYLDYIFLSPADNTYGASLGPDIYPWLSINNGSTKGSFQLMGPDINSRRNFQYYTTAHPGSMGYYQPQLLSSPTATIHWTGPGLNSNKAMVKHPITTSGLHEYVATLQLGSCILRDTVRVRVSGLGSTDYMAPILSEPIITASGNCTSNQYTLQLRAREPVAGSGIAQLILETKNLQEQIQLFPLPRISGNSQDGIYEMSLALPIAGSVNYLRAYAIDSNQNVSDTLSLNFIRNHAPYVKINNDTTVTAGSNLVLSAKTRGRTRTGLHISEVIYNWGGAGTQPTSSLPAGFPSLTGGRDLVEITNYTQDTLSTDSLILRFVRYSNGPYTLNLPLPIVVLVPGEQLYLVPGSGISESNKNFFYLGLGTNNIVDSAQPHGWLLIDKNGNQVISAVATGNLLFNPSENVAADVWSGAGLAGTSGTAGMHRISLANNASAFQVSSSANLTNVGSSAALLYQYPVKWYANNSFIGRGAMLNYTPNGNTVVIAMADTLFCPVYDTTFIQVNGSSQATDVRVKRIISPLTQPNTASTPVSIVLQNIGTIPVAQIPVAYRAGSGTTVLDTMRMTLMTGDSVVFTFQQNWMPPIGLDTPFCVFTQLTSDTNRANDTLCLLAGALPVVVDLQVDSILSIQPGEPIFGARNLSIRLQNKGNFTLTNFVIYHQSGVQNVQEIVSGSFAAGASFTHTFAQSWLPPSNGLLNLCVYVRAANDVNSSNDTSCIQINGSISTRPEAKRVNELLIYPQPATNSCWLSWSKEMELRTYQLYNMHGKLIEAKPLGSDQQELQLNIENLAQGIYYIHFKGRDTEFSRKLLIQR